MAPYNDAADRLETGEAPMQSEKSGKSNLFISPDHLPEGVSESLKPGEKLTLTLVGKDADGDLEFEYDHPGGGAEGEGADWRADMRATVEPGGY